MRIVHYPFTNKELAADGTYRGKDQFFNLVEVTRNEDGVFHIHIRPDLPVAAKNDVLRDQVNATSPDGRKILSRSDVKKQNHQLGDNIRTLGAGVFPWVIMPDGSERLVLLQRDKDAPAAPLAYMQPAGLVAGDHPFLAMFRETTEETCVFSVDDAAKILTVHPFHFPDEWKSHTFKSSDEDAIIAKKPNNLDHIYRNIAQHHPEYAGYDIQFSGEPLPSTDLQEGNLNTALFHLADGSTYTLKCLICDDPVNKSLDFSCALKIDMRNFPVVKNVDPEPFGRAPKLATRTEIHSLEIVTAPLQQYRETMTVEPVVTTTPHPTPAP